MDVKKTTFDSLTDDDQEGHEHYESKEEILETFSRYYNTKITPDTELQIVKFELLA